MRIGWLTVALVLITGCTTGTVGGSASPSRTAGATSTQSTSPSQAASPFATRLDCGNGYTPARSMALYLFAETPTTPSVLEVLDVTTPTKPALLCTLTPADGGRFDQSANEVIFWVGDKLGSADLRSGRVVQTGQLAGRAFDGAYSRDGSAFAYRVADEAGGMTTHVHGGGYDVKLYDQPPLGGHGGPPSGPVDQLAFSADGRLLLDYYVFRPSSGPPKFLVYRMAGLLGSTNAPDSFIAFKSDTASSGVWSSTGNTLYFFVWGQQGSGELDTLDATGQTRAFVNGMPGYSWPTISPDGKSIVYTAYDTSDPGSANGGLPHLWRIDLASRVRSQVSTKSSSRPAFVGGTVVWSDEEIPCLCGPGGSSMGDGVILAHDLNSGGDSTVNADATVPGIGLSSLPAPSTRNVLDLWTQAI